MSPEVLLLGSNGFLGLHALDALRALGAEPRCGRRRRSNVLGLRARKAAMVPADLDDPDALSRAMAGCEVVVHVAGHYPKTSLDPQTALHTGLSQSDRVLDAAAAAGVRRLVYVSSTGTVAPAPGGGPSDERHTFPTSPGHGVYHDLKWAMEQRFAEETRLQTIIACPAACVGPGDLRVGTSAILVGLARGMDPPHPDGWVSLVDPRDVGQGLARLALDPSPPHRVLLSGGSYRLHALLERLARRYGVARPSAPLSPDKARFLADAAEAAAAGTPDRPALSREIVDLVIHGVPLSTSRAEDALGLRWTSLQRTLDDFDGWARRLGIVPSPPEIHP